MVKASWRYGARSVRRYAQYKSNTHRAGSVPFSGPATAAFSADWDRAFLVDFLLNDPDPKAEADISLIQSQTLQCAPTFRELEGLIYNHISEQVLVRATVMMS